jgi:hypothetical protein
MSPEQRRYWLALFRSLPWSFVGLIAALTVCIAVGAPLWLGAVIVTAVVILIPWWRTRDEAREMFTAARKRR